ncbi:hypothetical protein [Streptomyces bambusae]|uniref:hypothetical protein n=1 Tax=Streptomyces bambusae TaxID=1550616 RepID=UPI002155E15F|nr:hypothetical protein [Streptomyces bambusae]
MDTDGTHGHGGSAEAGNGSGAAGPEGSGAGTRAFPARGGQDAPGTSGHGPGALRPAVDEEDGGGGIGRGVPGAAARPGGGGQDSPNTLDSRNTPDIPDASGTGPGAAGYEVPSSGDAAAGYGVPSPGHTAAGYDVQAGDHAAAGYGAPSPGHTAAGYGVPSRGHVGARAAAKVPRPAGPPPMPAHAPRTAASAGTALADWLRTPRPEAEPGIWRLGHVPRPEPDPDAATPARSLLSSALISFLACALLWSLIRNGYLEAWDEPLKLFTPGDWWDLHGEPVPGHGGMTAKPLYELLFDAALLYGFGRLGRWRTAWNRLVVARGPWVRAAAAAAGALLTVVLVRNYQLPLRQLVYSLLPFGPDGLANKQLVDTADLWVDVAVVLAFALLGGWFRLLTGRAARGSAARGDATAGQPGAGAPSISVDSPSEAA